MIGTSYDPSARARACGVGAVLGVALVAAVLMACQEDVLINPFDPLEAILEPSDTTIEVGDNVTLRATVEYRAGPGSPTIVDWTTTNENVVALTLVDGEPRLARVDGIAVGQAMVIARMNNAVTDTSRIQVVAPATP